MKKCLMTIVLLLAAIAVQASRSAPIQQRDPKNDAVAAYNDGLRYRDRAWKAEKELPDAKDDATRTKLEQIIRKSYEADVRSQRDAIRNDPNLTQAHAELGYALRKTGDYAAALASYDKALTLMPNYAQAIEYRGEAYLALNRVAEAKEAYLTLYNGGDPENARLLSDAMQKWVTARKSDPAGLAPESIEETAKWIAQRLEITKQKGTGTAGSGSWR
jgi:tetratricopeptide (TPR) repeat protein